jgi:hypothetical protein
MDGVTTIVKVAHVHLCHSRMMLVRAYPRETQEMVFDAHERAFAFFKGACGAGTALCSQLQNFSSSGCGRQAMCWASIALCGSTLISSSNRRKTVNALTVFGGRPPSGRRLILA